MASKEFAPEDFADEGPENNSDDWETLCDDMEDELAQWVREKEELDKDYEEHQLFWEEEERKMAAQAKAEAEQARADMEFVQIIQQLAIFLKRGELQNSFALISYLQDQEYIEGEFRQDLANLRESISERLGLENEPNSFDA